MHNNLLLKLLEGIIFFCSQWTVKVNSLKPLRNVFLTGRCTFGGSPESGYTVRQTLFKGARLKHGNDVQFACKATYTLVGSSSLHCDNGNWNGSVPACKGMDLSVGEKDNKLK